MATLGVAIFFSKTHLASAAQIYLLRLTSQSPHSAKAASATVPGSGTVPVGGGGTAAVISPKTETPKRQELPHPVLIVWVDGPPLMLKR